MYDFASAYILAQALEVIASTAAIGLIVAMVIQD
jgi:hypothetical protein